MHPSSIWHMRDCAQRYLKTRTGTVLEVGSASANATTPPFRELFENMAWRYEGLDLVKRFNVDIVATDPFLWPMADASYDAVISGQMLEHNSMFWLSFLEMARVLKPGGFMIHIAPSRGHEHRAPTDCWRFYRDGMHAIATWAGLECIEATTDWSKADLEKMAEIAPRRHAAILNQGKFAESKWGDTVGVFRKPQNWHPSAALRYMSALSRKIEQKTPSAS